MAGTPRKPRKPQAGSTTRRATRRVAGRTAPTAPAQPAAGREAVPPKAGGRPETTPSSVQESPSTVQPTASSVQQSPSTVQESPSTVQPTASSVQQSPSSVQPTASSVQPTASSVQESPSTEPDDTPAKPTGKTRPVARVSTIKPAIPTPTSDDAPKRRFGRTGKSMRTRQVGGGVSTKLVIALAAVAAVLGVFALVAGLHPGASIGPNKAFVDQAATTELTSQAQDKVCVAIAANGTDVDAWSNKARAVLTGKALQEFNQYLPQQKQILEQTKAVADCRVDALGVNNLSGDSDGSTATIIANMIISETINGQASNSGVPRVQFSMVKKGDQWLIGEVEAF